MTNRIPFRVHPMLATLVAEPFDRRGWVFDGKDLRREPLPMRRAVMMSSIGSSPVLPPSRRLEANGRDAFRTAKRRGYEGLIAKETSAPYVEGRSAKWLKVKVHQEEEFVICGYTKPAGSRRSTDGSDLW